MQFRFRLWRNLDCMGRLYWGKQTRDNSDTPPSSQRSRGDRYFKKSFLTSMLLSMYKADMQHNKAVNRNRIIWMIFSTLWMHLFFVFFSSFFSITCGMVFIRLYRCTSSSLVGMRCCPFPIPARGNTDSGPESEPQSLKLRKTFRWWFHCSDRRLLANLPTKVCTVTVSHLHFTFQNKRLNSSNLIFFFSFLH